MRAILLIAALLSAGCLGVPEPSSTPTPTPTATLEGDAPAGGAVEVYHAQIDFSFQTFGNLPLDMPAGAKHFNLTVEWSSTAPATVTGTVFVEIRDADGDVAAGCTYAVGISQPAEQSCDQTSSVTNGPYELAWDGTGTVSADVLVTAM